MWGHLLVVGDAGEQKLDQIDAVLQLCRGDHRDEMARPGTLSVVGVAG
jgi:hypothetical protein